MHHPYVGSVKILAQCRILLSGSGSNLLVYQWSENYVLFTSYLERNHNGNNGSEFFCQLSQCLNWNKAYGVRDALLFQIFDMIT